METVAAEAAGAAAVGAGGVEERDSVEEGAEMAAAGRVGWGAAVMPGCGHTSGRTDLTRNAAAFLTREGICEVLTHHFGQRSANTENPPHTHTHLPTTACPQQSHTPVLI